MKQLRQFMLVMCILALPIIISAQETSFQDANGAFTLTVPQKWTVHEEAGYVQLSAPEDAINFYALAFPISDTLESAIEIGWETVGVSIDRETENILNPPSQPGVDETLMVEYQFDPQAQNTVYHAVAQQVDDTVYLSLLVADFETMQRRAAQVDIAFSSFSITAAEWTDLTGKEPRAIDNAMTAQWEAYIEALMPRFDIPGVAVAIVQNGEIVYTNGFGIREKGSDVPMTPDTHMLIGSTGKSLTTTMMATMIDDGLFDWDTPVIEVMPQFSVADPVLSESITMKNLVCACTGVPRRDIDLFFTADQLTAEIVVESLQSFEFFTDFGEAFQYSNQMVATGGYAAAAATDAEYGSLLAGYSEALDLYVLQPLNMENTTLSFDQVLSRGEYAMPHAYNMDGLYSPIPVDYEMILLPFAPAGSHWSTTEDMAQYMVMQLQNGTALDGTVIASADNLLVTREPQVSVNAERSYGLGWFVDAYKGLHLVHHGGNTLGFTSDFAFLPEQELGVVVLTNAQYANSFNELVRTRLFDLVFDDVDDAEDTEQVEFVLQGITSNMGRPENMLDTVDEAAVTPYTGTYANDALGEITVELIEGKLYLDAGEFRTELLPITQAGDPESVSHYMMIDPPTRTMTLRFMMSERNEPQLVIGQGVMAYTFTSVE